jgi:hypothetical protein
MPTWQEAYARSEEEEIARECRENFSWVKYVKRFGDHATYYAGKIFDDHADEDVMYRCVRDSEMEYLNGSY